MEAIRLRRSTLPRDGDIESNGPSQSGGGELGPSLGSCRWGNRHTADAGCDPAATIKFSVMARLTRCLTGLQDAVSRSR
jgi:hypothetical protein